MPNPRFDTTQLRRRLMQGAAAALVALFVAAPLAAQQTGQVIGRVISGQSGNQMSDVNVTVLGTQIGQPTNSDGRFIILQAPAGEQVIVAQIIGYGEQRRTVTVPAGGVASVDFTLYPSAIELEGVVVTGTAIEANKREVGNSISLITSEDIAAAGAMNFEDLLRGRALGVSVTGIPGSAGAGSDILLRGTNSITGRNTPLIYIDGVRMPSGAVEDARGIGSEEATFLGSISPEDIDRIEVIKGAAASSIYGTDASAGVIQIFTKKGSPGAPRWQLSVEQGMNRIGHVGSKIDPTGLRVNDCTRQLNFDPVTMEYFFNRDEQGNLIADPDCPDRGSWVRDGHFQDYNLNARGGNEDVTYYVSGGYELDKGVVAPNQAARMSARGNFTFNGFENFQISVNNSYTRRVIDWIPNGDTDRGLLFNVARGEEGDTPDNHDAEVFDLEQQQQINHFNTSMNLNWTPVGNLRTRFTVGLDYSNSNQVTQAAWLYFDDPDGERTLDIENRRVITMDWATSWNTTLPADLTSTLSFGAQYNQRNHTGNRTDVEGFIGFNDHVLENASDIQNVNEDRDATESGGFFLEDRIGWNNQLFITAGVRADTHSAFGEDYTRDTRFTLFPRAQVAYTISDHSFWPTSWFEDFRIRAAYGESGEAPPESASATLWQIAALADENELGFIILTLAQDDIGPERTREYEAGLEGSLFNGRLGFEATAWDRTTYDGIISFQIAPSGGIAENIPDNVGTWTANGIEAALDVIAYEGDALRLSLNGSYQYTETKLDSFGTPQVTGFNFNYLQRYRTGRPIPSFYGDKLANPDAVGELPEYEEERNQWIGPSRPPHEMSVGATVTVFDRLTLDAFGVGQYGHLLYDDMAQELAEDELWPPCWPINEAVKLGIANDDPSLYADIPTTEIAKCWVERADNEDWMESADYFRLQSASLSYRVPEAWLPSAMGINAATVQFRATNLFTITDFSGLYPDSLLNPAQQVARGNGYILPPAKSYILNLRVNF